jgi:ribose transport system permease protein
LLKQIVSSRLFYLFLIIVMLVIFIGLLSEIFFTIDNAKVLLFAIATNAIIAAGMTVLMITGNFDLSPGSTMAATGMILGLLLSKGFSSYYAVIITLLAGITIGFLTGLLVGKIGLNPFIATLSMMFILRGLALVIGLTRESEDTIVPIFTDFPKSFQKIAGGTFLGIEYIFYYSVIVIIIFHFLVTKNVFFRQNFYIGGNKSAAILAGIKVRIIIILNFVLVSTLATITSILRSSRLLSANAMTGENIALEVIAAVIIGGASIKGGSGSVLGSFLGVIIIALIYNGMTLLSISPLYSKMIIGIILLVSVLIDEYRDKFKFTKKSLNRMDWK